jgi:hypothetical protein
MNKEGSEVDYYIIVLETGEDHIIPCVSDTHEWDTKNQ